MNRNMTTVFVMEVCSKSLAFVRNQM